MFDLSELPTMPVSQPHPKIGKNAKQLSLKAKGWTQCAAAAEIGISCSFLSDVLNGRRKSPALLEILEELPVRKEVADV